MDDSELLGIFWEEVRDYLERMNSLLLSLEMSLSDEDAGGFVERLRELNRLAHSLKGAARSVGQTKLETLGFHMEEVFDASLKRGLALTPDVCDLLYDALDLVGLSAAGTDIPPAALTGIIERIEHTLREERLASDDVVHVPGPAAPPPAQLPQPPTSPGEDTIRISVGKLDTLMAESNDLLMARLQSEERQRQVRTLRKGMGRWAREWRAVRTVYIRLARQLQEENGNDDLRSLLEFLEANQRHLLATSRQVNTLAGQVAQDALRLATLSDTLQDSISALRLVPFETIIGVLQRTLRDAARETGKDAYLDVVGSNTEIDKAVLQQLKDPLMHLVRNAADHGLEPPNERQAAGKNPAGWVLLTVETRGSEIIIHVADDGRGIDVERVRAAAVAAGVVTQAEANSLPDEDLRELIFHPGLTTRNNVTAISGRGVGMDVVRSRVEGLRGHIQLTSTPGQGTTTTISLPVSLTRIRCVLVEVGGEHYALPALSVGRMEQVEQDAPFVTEGQTHIHLGEHTLPLVHLADLLGAPPPRPQDELRVVMLRAGERQVALVVDDLLSERELVLKPLGPELQAARYVGGAALLGGGEVVIVLDANDLVRGAVGSRLPGPGTSTPPPPAPRAGPLRVLIVDDSITTRTLEQSILETAGYEVQAAVDGQQAWDLLHHDDFDVVVSDVEMPRLDGLGLTRRIKEDPATRHIPVVLLTSLNSADQRDAGLAAGAEAYLVKSDFDQDMLLGIIRSVVADA